MSHKHGLGVPTAYDATPGADAAEGTYAVGALNGRRHPHTGSQGDPAAEPGPERARGRVLWVDPVPADIQEGCDLLASRHLEVRQVARCEEAGPLLADWAPQVLLLEYVLPAGSMAYETFVHAVLPTRDPYRAGGPLAANAWGRTEMPLLLVSGGAPARVPGYVNPHLARAVHFLPKPLDAVRCLQLVENLLRPGTPARVLDLTRSQLRLPGAVHALSPQGLEILVVLARAHPQSLPASALARELYRRRGMVIGEGQVRTAIRRLRQRLETDPSQPRLVGNLGQGYFLGEPLCVEGDDQTPD